MSITSTLRSWATKAPARFIAVVVLPTPPLLLEIPSTRVVRAGGEMSVIFAVFLGAMIPHPREVELAVLFIIKPRQAKVQVFS